MAKQQLFKVGGKSYFFPEVSNRRNKLSHPIVCLNEGKGYNYAELLGKDEMEFELDLAEILEQMKPGPVMSLYKIHPGGVFKVELLNGQVCYGLRLVDGIFEDSDRLIKHMGYAHYAVNLISGSLICPESPNDWGLVMTARVRLMAENFNEIVH